MNVGKFSGFQKNEKTAKKSQTKNFEYFFSAKNSSFDCQTFGAGIMALSSVVSELLTIKEENITNSMIFFQK